MDSNQNVDPNQVKFAVAVALLRSKLFSKSSSTSASISSSSSESNSLRWKRKAKDRKQEILRLKQELKELEDGGDPQDLFPQSANCKCYFFDNCGKFSPTRRFQLGDGSNFQINQILHRRFLRQVRLKERRRRRDGSAKQGFDINVDYEIEQLNASADFLVELCKTMNPVENDKSFSNFSHQAVDFILESFSSDAQFYIQHLLRKLGNDPYIGQRTMLAVSLKVSVLAEGLLFVDPFDNSFPIAHSCMFIMIQLMEFLITDYTKSWTSDESFEIVLFEGWLKSVLQARKALALLESRLGLYMLYIDRVTGELAKEVGQVSCLQNLNPDILENLFR